VLYLCDVVKAFCHGFANRVNDYVSLAVNCPGGSEGL